MMFADEQELLHEEEDALIDVPVLDTKILSSQSSPTSQSDDNYEPANKKLTCAGIPLDVKGINFGERTSKMESPIAAKERSHVCPETQKRLGTVGERHRKRRNKLG